jgi:hypothetical protein
VKAMNIGHGLRKPLATELSLNFKAKNIKVTGGRGGRDLDLTERM